MVSPPTVNSIEQLAAHSPSLESIELNFVISTAPQSSAWYLDFGATHHVTGNSNLFYTLQHTTGNNLCSAGGHGHSVSRIGDVHFRFPEGNTKAIPGVMYSPTIQKNLLSVGFIADQNHSLEFTSEGCYIRRRDTKDLIAFVSHENGHGLYRLHGETLLHSGKANSISIEGITKSDLWHKQLGHFHRKGIVCMIKVAVVSGLPNMQVSDRPCICCLKGK
jgi:hypothetical protein